MTEDEKQNRANSCTPEEFNKLAEELVEKAFELYSIATRVDGAKLAEFVNYRDEHGRSSYEKIEVANKYAYALAGTTSGFRAK